MTGHARPALGTGNPPDTTNDRQVSPSDVAMEDLFFYDVGISSKKRKSPGPDSESETLGQSTQPGQKGPQPAKKARLIDEDNAASLVSSGLVKDKSLLPPEVWHHIFTFCSPRTLITLLQVNKLFNVYINPSSSVQVECPSSAQKGVLSPLKANSILVASRRNFWPHVPAPLRSIAELDMWKLLCSKRCHECNKSDAGGQGLPMNHMNAGPGREGVSVVWPLGIRVCGQCLLQKTVKDIDLLLSSTFPSLLLPALPFTYVTQDLEVVTLTSVERGQLPPETSSKRFLSSDVKELEEEFFSVKELGAGAMDEWMKGLPVRGQKRLNEAKKWEKWAASGNLQQVQAMTGPYLPANNGHFIPGIGSGTASTLQGAIPPNTAALIRQGRTKEEVDALRANRKLEIERRAALLDPPIPPNVLQHMTTFQAAIQITTPFDEKAWDVLKPRLLAEKVTAEVGITEPPKSSVSTPTQTNDVPVPELPDLEATLASTKAAKDAIDQHWEQVQAPLRARIIKYADEVIREEWDEGEKVNKENCSRFAAEVLIHIRKRFYANAAKEEAKAKAAGKEPVTDPPEGPFTQKLTLENMKWIFEYKIKPLTQPFKKDIFYCNGCPGKPFGFEGVNQHYAAKHTSALSAGNIVVHWRAEWPEVPPFNPEGKSKSGHDGGSNDTSNGNSRLPPPPAGVNVPKPYNSGRHPTHPLPPIPPPIQSYGPAPTSGPPYPTAPYLDPYAQHYPGYQPPPAGYPAPPPGVPPHSYAPQAPQPWASAPPGQLYNPYQTGPPPDAYPPSSGYPHVPPVPPPTAHSHAPNPYNYPGGGYVPAAVPTPVATYHIQLESIVRDAREVWSATANIKDLPGSIRVQSTIYHVVKRFRSKFGETPSLAMFQDGLSNNKDMRPVRNINSLICKACFLNLGNAASLQKDKADYSLPQLVNHFQSKHVELMLQVAPNSPPLDWTSDMVLLPGPHIMSTLPEIVGTNVQKRRLFSDAFPEFFDPSAPNGVNSYRGQHLQAANYQPQAQPPAHEQPRERSFDNHDAFYGPNLNPSSQAPSQHAEPGRSVGYQQQHHYVYNQGVSANGFGASQQPATSYAEHSAPAPTYTPGVLWQDPDSREKSAGQSSHSSKPKPEPNGSQGNKQGKNKNGPTRNKDHIICHKCNQRGHISRECPKKNAVQVTAEDDEQQRRETDGRALGQTDRPQGAREDRASKQDNENGRHVSNVKVSQDRVTKRTSNQNSPRQRVSPPAPRDRRAEPPRQQTNLLDALEMQLQQAEQPGTAQRRQTQANSVGLRTLAERTGYQREDSAPQYEDRPHSNQHRQRSLSLDAGYRALAPPGHPRQFPGDEYVIERRREPPRDPYERRYADEQVIYERLPTREYRPHPDDRLPPSPQARPTGQFYEIVEMEDEHGRYIEKRPINLIRPPQPMYEPYPYEDDRQRLAQTSRIVYPELEPYPPRAQPAPVYETAYPPTRTQPPPTERVHYRDPYPRQAPPPPPPQPRQQDGYSAHPRDSANYGRRPPVRYEEPQGEYDPRNPAAR